MFFSVSTVAMMALTAAAMPFQPAGSLARREFPLLNATSFSNSTSVNGTSTGAAHHNGTLHLTNPVKRHSNPLYNTMDKRSSCVSTPSSSTADDDDGGRGITITNSDTERRGFYVYANGCDSVPYRYLWIEAGSSGFITLPEGFQGRITRGTDEHNLSGCSAEEWLGTWFEIGYDADGQAYADVSLIRGCDGAVTICSGDGTGATAGFSQWILDGAPDGAYATKPSGAQALAAAEGLDGAINTVVRDWYMDKVGQTNAYVDDYHGNPVIHSSNGRFDVSFLEGRP